MMGLDDNWALGYEFNALIAALRDCGGKLTIDFNASHSCKLEFGKNTFCGSADISSFRSMQFFIDREERDPK